MKLAIVTYVVIKNLILLNGCASVPNRHLRSENSLDREVAYDAFGYGVLIGTIGSVVGFATRKSWALPVFFGGFALGVGGLTYLVHDDHLRQESYRKSLQKIDNLNK